MLKWVMIKGEFNIIKTYIITSYHNCIKQVKYEERKNDLNNEFKKIYNQYNSANKM